MSVDSTEQRSSYQAIRPIYSRESRPVSYETVPVYGGRYRKFRPPPNAKPNSAGFYCLTSGQLYITTFRGRPHYSPGEESIGEAEIFGSDSVVVGVVLQSRYRDDHVTSPT